MTFYSSHGRRILAKIWREQDLDKDFVLSCWIGSVPSKSFIADKVHEYIQAFLQNKNKEIMLLNQKLILEHLRASEEDYYFDHDYNHPSHHQKFRSAYEKVYEFQRVAGAHRLLMNQLFEKRMRERELNEKQRIRRLILERRMDAPEGFTSVVFKLNIMEDRLRRLEKELNDLQVLNADYGPLPVWNDNYYSVCRKRKKRKGRRISKEKRSIIEGSNRVTQHIDETGGSLLSSAVPSMVDSIVDENSTPPFSISEAQIQSIIKHGMFVDQLTPNSAIWSVMEEQDRGYSSDIEDAEIFCEARSHNFYGATTDLDFDHSFGFSEELVLHLLNEKDTELIFSKAEQALAVSSSRLEEAKNKVIKINRVHFEKMFASFGPF